MTEKGLEVVIALLLSLTGGGIGFLSKRYLDKKRELFNENAKERRQAYQDFVNIIIDVFSNIKKEESGEEKIDVIDRLYAFYKKNILFAPPNVVIAFSDYMQYLYVFDNKDEKQTFLHLKKLTNVMKEMRKDLGLSNKNLGDDGEILMRAIINDFDRIKT